MAIRKELKELKAIYDVLVGTETKEGHDNLYIKPEKCEWKVKEVSFLGVVMGPNGIKIKKEKMREILEWPAPRCVKDIQKLLGLVNYYRRFVKDFAKIARPLHKLVCKEEK